MTNFSWISLNESRRNSSSGSCGPVQSCPGTTVHLVYISVICVVGVIGNILLLYADYKEWKKRKTPDKVLIFNLALTNLAALLVSLPLQAVLIANFHDYLRCVGSLYDYYSARFFSTILLNFVTLGTLVVIGIDRYEALTKFTHQRTLDVKKSIVAIGLVWLCSTAVVVVFIVTGPSQCTNFYSSHFEDKNTNIYKLIRIAIISIWITVCCTVTSQALLRAARRIRQHRQQINTMFGPVQAAVQISFTRGVTALSLCYVILWIPYGVASAIQSSDQYNVQFLCSRLWTASTCYLGFSVLPVIYFTIDNRLRRVILPKITAAPEGANSLEMTQRNVALAQPKANRHLAHRGSWANFLDVDSRPEKN